MQQNTQVTKGGPTTIKGLFHAKKRSGEDMSLKQLAREVVAASNVGFPKGVVADAKRWLTSKRPGGTDGQRAARRAKRKEQQAMRAMRGKAKTGSLKPSGEGKKGRGK